MSRLDNPVMEFYRTVYRYSKRWKGKESLEDKTVLVYFEQGFGDCIQFLRYIKDLKNLGCKVILHIPKELFPLLSDPYLDKHCSVLPKHDYHVLSLDLPFLLKIKEISPEPYIFYDKKADLGEYKNNIGIAWEGSPDHERNFDRCCPLKHFKIFEENLFMLQNKVNLPELVEEVDFPIYSIPINDFGDTASLINAVDTVITVDTSILHLAGAMGKRTYGILGPDADPRWKVGNWYESVTLFQGEWVNILSMIKSCR